MIFIIAGLAVFAAGLGFDHARTQRLRAICREHGHQWADGPYGMICARCARSLHAR